jgi:hypothetical protein
VVLAAFLVSLVLVLGSTVFVAVRGLALWRDARGTGKRISDELSLFDERSARTERLLADAEKSSQELDAALERLRISRARLDVLLRSLEAAQRRMRWLRVLLPLR